jgi:hypothetical protein
MGAGVASKYRYGARVTRSLPEKTFEHWCSMHLSYRYRAKMLMWWPSSSADIVVAYVPKAWGKRFWLELKTPEWNAKSSRHDLFVDLVQLNQYGQQAVPDFYVFPLPPWDGVLGPTTTSAWLAKIAPERLAYESWSAEKWFAKWTWVVPGWKLRDALRAEISALPSGTKKKPHRVAEIKAGAVTWLSPSLGSVPLRRWRDFWAHMDECGDQDWPAQFLLPPNSTRAATVQRSELAAELRSLAKADKAFDDRVVPYDRGINDQYGSRGDGQTAPSDFVWHEASRAMVVLSEHALRL